MVPFTLPPDTRSVGSGNPPQDMNAVVDALTALGAGRSVLNTAFAGGADPTGTTDSTAAFQAAVASMPTTVVNNGTTSATYPVGTLLLPPGTYKIGSSGDIGNLGPFVSVIGPGSTACFLYYYGNGGDCLRAFNAIRPSDFYFDTMLSQADPYGLGTKYDGFTIDGRHATGVSAGLHVGDFEGGVLGPDLHIQNFFTGTLVIGSSLAASAIGSGGTFSPGTYFWTITALSRTGETLPSNEVTATIVSNGSASLTWSAVSGAIAYNIYRGTAAGAENTYVTQVGAVTAYTDTGSSAVHGQHDRLDRELARPRAALQQRQPGDYAR
jgi:hypothetical protein